MEPVNNITEIIENARRADCFLSSGSYEEREFMLEKISRGMCFVVVKDGGEYKFYPSKYIGYKDNNPTSYTNAYYNAMAYPEEKNRQGDAAYHDFDGRVSNKAINKILGCSCVKDDAMSEKFVEFCNKYGLKGSTKRKFWLNVVEL